MSEGTSVDAVSFPKEDWSFPSWEDERIRFDPETMIHTGGIVKTNAAPEPVDPDVVEVSEVELHLADLLDTVMVDLASKYLNGQKDHGGLLHRKPGLIQHAKEEALDQVAYLYSLEQQHLGVCDLLREGLAHQRWSSVAEAYNILIYGNAEGEVYNKGGE